MNIKDEAVKAIADSIIFGYGKASIKFVIKLLVFIVCHFENIPKEKMSNFESDLSWMVEEKIKELKKETR
jgi:hypothetical protein